MPETARDIISLAFREVGVLGVGQTLLAEDMTNGFTLLKRMMAQWQKRRWLVPSLEKIATLGNGLESNAIGPGQYWNAFRPSGIKAGWIVQVNTGPNIVSLPLRVITAYEDYARIAVKTLNSLPAAVFYDGAYPNGNIRVWPIPSAQYQVNLIVQSQIGFNTGISAGSFVGGTGYTNGAVLAVPLTGGSGSGATADITVAGGIVTVVTIVNPGDGYKLNDILSSASIGAGIGFAYTVNNLNGTVDSQCLLPEEYLEPIHYGLSMRFSTMYKRPLSKAQVALAKASLNTLRIANAQVPSMVMPAGLNSQGAYNIYSDSYGQ